MAITVSDNGGWEPTLGFDSTKAVQTLAYFLRRAASPQDKMKLVKLVYLADRESFARRARPLNFDQYYSMKDGPVPSSILNGINGTLRGRGTVWKAISLAKDKRTVTLTRDVPEDHLSASDRAILDSVWEKFGQLSAAQLRHWTHVNCEEYADVGSSRLSINYDDILEALGVEDADARARELQILQKEMGRLPKANAA